MNSALELYRVDLAYGEVTLQTYTVDGDFLLLQVAGQIIEGNRLGLALQFHVVVVQVEHG